MKPNRLMYSKSRRAFVFVAGSEPVRLDGNPMFYRRKSEAIRAALKEGLLADEKTGHVTQVGEGQSAGRLGNLGEDLSELGKVATLRTRVGTRVRFAPNPASITLYSNPPSVGEEGEVTTVAHIGGRRSFMPGPGGGLLYIKWDRTGHQGVSPRDIEVVGRSRKAERELSNVETHIEGLEGVSKSDKLNSIGDFTTAYIEAALWSTNDESDESGGVPLDENYGFSDLTNDALDKMIKDCRDFQSANAELLSRAGNDAQNGHDFWLTRNGHGAGFWDRGYDDEVGKGLTDAAHAYGNVYLYVSRGKIHHD